MPPGDPIAPRRRPSPWAWLVAGSAALLLAIALVFGVWWLSSRETEIATYSVRGAVSEVMLDLAGANAVVVGGGSAREIDVRSTDEFSFGRRARSRRDVEGARQLREPVIALPELGGDRSETRASIPQR